MTVKEMGLVIVSAHQHFFKRLGAALFFQPRIKQFANKVAEIFASAEQKVAHIHRVVDL
jgi:hypothetical protein